MDVLFPDFFRFFCHWDSNVRCLFHLFLLYRCCRRRRSFLPLLSSGAAPAAAGGVGDLLRRLDDDKLREIACVQSSLVEEDCRRGARA